MHDTARCLGYPSDSLRAARERAPGDVLQSPCGLPTRPCGSTPALVAHLPPLWLTARPCGSTAALRLISRPCGSTTAPVAHLSPLWLNCRLVAHLSPLWLNCRPVVRLSPLWLNYRPVALHRTTSPLWLTFSPPWLDYPSPGWRRRLPLAIGHGRSAWGPRYRARSNQAPASLPPRSACSGRRAWAGRDCVRLPARHVLSLTWAASGG